MCKPALEAAELLAADGFDVSVVNARFLKPMDREMLDALAQSHKLLVTVEDGTVVNGFGAALAALVQTTAPDVRVVALGVPDRTYEHAPRAQQLADVGLTASGSPPVSAPSPRKSPSLRDERRGRRNPNYPGLGAFLATLQQKASSVGITLYSEELIQSLWPAGDGAAPPRSVRRHPPSTASSRSVEMVRCCAVRVF